MRPKTVPCPKCEGARVIPQKTIRDENTTKPCDLCNGLGEVALDGRAYREYQDGAEDASLSTHHCDIWETMNKDRTDD